MRAIVQSQYGEADVLGTATIDRPAIGPSDVLVQVRAAGLDRGTWHLMAGKPYAIRLAGFGVRAPKNPVPGIDVAGVVVAVGGDVTRFQPGDEVYGIGKGTFAEYTAAPEHKLASKPSNLTFTQAAAVPVSALTALKAVCDVGRVQPGQRVLVIGASGGVGTYAVQLAKAFGAEVTGVASTAKVDFVRSIGADHVIDYTREDFAAGGVTYDVILDIGGSSTLARMRRALTPTGTLAIVGGENGGSWIGMDRQVRALAMSPFLSQRLATVMAKEHFTGLERLTSLIEDGRIVPAVERAYALSDAPTAMRQLVAGRVRGKLVITP
jgi:NADPH:quinone reductase-like Zn-dependent oxidoreductase